MRIPRVAYFPDSFHEINGVAHTSRNFVRYAEAHRLPFLCVRAGDALPVQSDSVSTLDLPRSRGSIALEKDLDFDPLFLRHGPAIAKALKAFRPDLIHITGPSELGIFGAYFAWKLGIPLAASWHTNVHEYASTRLLRFTRRLSPSGAATVQRQVERVSLLAASRLYRLARVLFAPNPELCAMLERATRKPVHLMPRGVDVDLFTPAHRDRTTEAIPFVLGYVGRLSVEKNVLLLARIEGELLARGVTGFQFLIIGQGKEEPMLRAQLQHATFAGVLRGADLARAYANMDALVFPSHTDTFGNVVLEALASGVPAVVTPGGGPKYIVREGETGYITEDDGFTDRVERLIRDPGRLSQMRLAARNYALGCSWNTVFSNVYSAYRTVLPAGYSDRPGDGSD